MKLQSEGTSSSSTAIPVTTGALTPQLARAAAPLCLAAPLASSSPPSLLALKLTRHPSSARGGLVFSECNVKKKKKKSIKPYTPKNPGNVQCGNRKNWGIASALQMIFRVTFPCPSPRSPTVLAASRPVGKPGTPLPRTWSPRHCYTAVTAEWAPVPPDTRTEKPFTYKKHIFTALSKLLNRIYSPTGCC